MASHKKGIPVKEHPAMTEMNMMRFSSIIEGITGMLYVEREHTIIRLLNVQKMRGPWHSNSIFQYEMTNSGIHFGEIPDE